MARDCRYGYTFKLDITKIVELSFYLDVDLMQDNKTSALTFVFGKLAEIRAILIFDLKNLWYPALAITPIVCLLTGLLYSAGMLGAERPLKDMMENISPPILAVAAGLALVRLAISKSPYFIWLAILCGSLFCRELHFEGTSIGIYVALVILLLVAGLKYSLFAEYFSSRTVITLVTCVFFTYFIAMTFDQRWYTFIPNARKYYRPVGEIIEVTGHIFTLMLVLLSRKTSPVFSPAATR